MRTLIGIVRIALGSLLLVAGMLKAHDGPLRTMASIAGYRLFPAPVNAMLGVVLPYLEIVLALYLVAGFFTRGAAIVAAVQFVVFAGAVASLVVRGLAVDCGCFGSALATPPSWWHVAGDLALALAAAAVARWAPGVPSVDAASRRGDRIEEDAP